MSRVYLSFLGTNNYLPCTYYSTEQVRVADVRFVQSATVQMNCIDWNENDRILIFTTEEAHRKNWLDNGHRNPKTGDPVECAGLARVLEGLGLRAPVRSVPIPEGKDLKEIWAIFQVLFDQLNDCDRAVFDLTHAFRSIPVLAMVVLNYAKVMKNLAIDKICYGAFEVLGSIDDARRLAPENRLVPILDLTAFDALLDWTLAIDRFLGAGDASPALTCAEKAVLPILKETKGMDREAAIMRKAAAQLETFTKVLATCRGPEISDAAARLNQQLSQCEKSNLIPPLKPLFKRIRETLGKFDGNRVRDGLQAARWCLEHNLIQQGYTILQEIVVTHLAVKAGVDHEKREYREMAGRAAAMTRKMIDPGTLTDNVQERAEVIGRYMEIFRAQPSLVGIFSELSDARNNLNHAGFARSSRSYDFPKKLALLIGRVEELVNSSAEPL
jgi:CRISPR-associated DxTHG motif protein